MLNGILNTFNPFLENLANIRKLFSASSSELHHPLAINTTLEGTGAASFKHDRTGNQINGKKRRHTVSKAPGTANEKSEG